MASPQQVKTTGQVIGFVAVLGSWAGLMAFGAWLGGKLADRYMEKVSQTIAEVATATGTAIGAGVQTAYAPPMEDVGGDVVRMRDWDGEALEPRPAYDPTLRFIGEVSPDGIAVVEPGTSLIPGDPGQ